MPLSESLVLVEIKVETLFSYVECKEFYLRSKFADIFTLNLKDPNDLDPFIFTKKLSKKSKVRSVKSHTEKPPLAGQADTVMFFSPIDTLITTMKNFPIELSVFNKDDPYWKLGSTYIPWSPVFIDYLYDNWFTKSTTPAQVSRSYTVYNELTSKRVAAIKLKIKLSLKDKLATTLRALNEDNRNTILHTGLNTKVMVRPMRETPNNNNNAGVIKVRSGDNRKKWPANQSKSNKKTKEPIAQEKIVLDTPPMVTQKGIIDDKCKLTTRIVSLVKSDHDLAKNKHIGIYQTTSCSDISRNKLNILNHNNFRNVSNETFVVSYFTVENCLKKDTSSSSNKKSTPGDSSDKSASSGTFKLNICEKDCPSNLKQDTCTDGMCSIDLPTADEVQYNIGKCKRFQCNSRPMRKLPPPAADDRIRLDVTKTDCCIKPQAIKNVTKAPQTIENIIGGMKANLKFKNDCYCSCECTFGFVKRTTYCETCSGYKVAAEDMPKHHLTAPHPCPSYHKLNKKKSLVVEPVRHKNCEDFLNRNKSADRATNADSVQGKGNKYKLDDRFIFHYGFTGIPPEIGHSKCALPCTGGARLGSPVPKNMGWLWTAENVPGLKFRPKWKPGAIHKHVLHLLKMAMHPGVISKRRRKDTGKTKKPLKRPLLTVAKKDGEYTVTMETMKIYPKQRARNQQPFEDKPLLNYTIGRTEEENRERREKKERDIRRLERDKREFIQSAFSDMCKDICLKTYQQALGILPGTGDPDCPCYPKEPGPGDINLDRSCSCSDDDGLLSLDSETDSDEWLVEFTPPNAIFDPTYVVNKVVKADHSTQYHYLDYKVKVLDRNGNQVPRFFKGPNGKTQCSDLGGFWSPEHKWLEINTDGYIGPDGRWAPLFFVGPKGEQIDCDDGKFQFVVGGDWYTVGIDGYVDGTGRWRFYPKPKTVPIPAKKRLDSTKKRDFGDKKDVKGSPEKPSEIAWSCFGDANPKELSKMGIFGHGNDRKVLLKALEDMMARGDNVRIPKPPLTPTHVKSKKNIKSTSPPAYDSHTYFAERQRCKHAEPSDKGIIAVDGYGNKTYFTLKDYKNRRPTERITNLDDQGISVSSFHVPCFTSFINSEIMKKQLLKRRLDMFKAKNPTSFGSTPKYIDEYRYIA